MSREWLKKIEKALGDDSNPTKYSLLFTLNNMANQLDEYKELGTVEELRAYKETALKNLEKTNKSEV